MKLLLVSDATMNVDQGGLSQTLYNLFCCWPPESILCTCSEKAFKNSPPSPPFTSRYVTYKFEIVVQPKNRLSKYLRKSIDWLNYSYNKHIRSFKYLKQQVADFNPDIIITCPNGPEALFMHYRLNSAFDKKPVFPYFMDDWLYQADVSWMNGNISVLAKKMLSEQLNWLMISRNLADILGERYRVKPRSLLTMHNPVDISSLPDAKPLQEKEEYTIAYAGALWHMHFDAFLSFAKAVHLLQCRKKIKMIVYTSEAQWNWRCKFLLSLGVAYGGHIPYKDIHHKLSEADLLLVTSSFSKEWITHSEGSIQTKITDYLKAGRLIISYGPSYAANHKFIRKYNCGVCFDTIDITILAEKIDNVTTDITNYRDCIKNGYNLLKTEFSVEKIHKKMLNHFLQALKNNDQ